MRARQALRTVAMLAAPLWWAVTFAAAPAAAAKDAPDIQVSAFPYQPEILHYFEDSDVILIHDFMEGVVYRSPDAGASWDKVTAIPAKEAARLVMHAYDNHRAYVLTEGLKHYRTEDQGKSWQSFTTSVPVSRFQYDALAFHAGDPDRIIFNGVALDFVSLTEVALFTTDGFRSDARTLRRGTGGCIWAQTRPEFTSGDATIDANRILCVVQDMGSIFKQDQRLVITDNFFSAGDTDGFEPNLDTNRPVQGITNIAAVKKYLLVATTAHGTDEMALFVTDDTRNWHRAMFPADHHITQEAYTVLESTNYSIQIDVMNSRPSYPTGVLFTSNSNGTFFTENTDYTNRDAMGHVDFEKISGIQGIFLVNRVINGPDVNDAHARKQIATMITFDDGRTFSPITVGGKDRLHLHSVTNIHNIGRVYSTPAPGLVMAVGNTGKMLGRYSDGNLYISDDAGLTWIEGPKGPHKYEFGDQGSILLAVRDAPNVDELTYSLDHGKTWQVAKLPDGLKVRPYILTTTQDSTSLKFLLIGKAEDRWNIIAIDFAGLHEATCKESDMEEWWARVDSKGTPTCLMGHKQRYHRRKKDAACFLNQEFKDPVVESIDCPCTDADFECDYNFRRNENGDCVQAGPIVVPEGACGKDAKPDDTFQGSSGWRLIPGNTCKRTSGKQNDDPVERKCVDSTAPPTAPASGKVENTKADLKLGGYTGFAKYYLERGDTSAETDESIVMRPVRHMSDQVDLSGPIFVTNDHGKTWTKPEVFNDMAVWDVVPHEYFKEMVFFLTSTERVIYTVDHGRHYHEFKAPYPPNRESDALMFHPDKKDWLIWIGEKCEQTGECYTEASYSRDRGDNWNTLLRYVVRCEFIGSSAYKFRQPEEVLCLARAREDSDTSNANPLQLVSSDDWFEGRKTVHGENVRGFATMAEFIFVAAEDPEEDNLRAFASLDGEAYADAQFPANLAVPKKHEYTVLDSSTHAVNLFVATETARDKRWGTIVKSNSNGTSYVLSIAGVNCDNSYYVDFEKILGLEGVLMVNVVANREDDKATSKMLQTQISHNDGAEWGFLSPPTKDVEDKAFECQPSRGASEGGDPNCALHIHGYTEREDHRRTYSSSGAVGLMFGLGHVGRQLGAIEDADTYMTTDAGVSWRQVKKGRWQWLFVDQGSIILLVQLHTETATLSYTMDEGMTWQDHVFSDKGVTVLDITTLRSGASRNVLLWCARGGPEEVFTINVDFSGLMDRACAHDDKDLDKSDYYLWSPSHPLLPDSQCLFGHVTRYLRKKTSSTCYNGYKIQHLYNIENCTCTRRDYECDYNFELDNHGQCSLVPGLKPLSRAQWCDEHPDEVDYYPPTGFRRIPLTTCVGGEEFDRLTEPQTCQNHEGENLHRHRGPSGVAIFFAVVVPVTAAAAAGWYVYRNWTGKFGAIRLGEQGTSTFALDSDAPYIRYPVMAMAGLVAVVETLPLLATALWRTAAGAVERWTGVDGLGGGGPQRAWSRLGQGLGLGGNGTRRFTTRDSFAQGRGEYAVVDDDEGELLGDDSDEDV